MRLNLLRHMRRALCFRLLVVQVVGVVVLLLSLLLVMQVVGVVLVLLLIVV